MDKLKPAEDSIRDIETTLEENNSIVHEEFNKVYQSLERIEKGVEEIDGCMGDNNVLNFELKQVYKKVKYVEKCRDEIEEMMLALNKKHEADIEELKQFMEAKFEKLEPANKDKDAKISLLIAQLELQNIQMEEPFNKTSDNDREQIKEKESND